ncbi:cell division protein ZapA [Tenacibaculum sp. UWU-22]|uniref:cell division protein ZapA n=1 Tax=Tenacibaculum sp. UWU-22 TaxID=3234187 RepID=UPI0034DB7904
MAKLKVNVVIAGRSYPLSVNNTQEEEGMRKAAKNINALIAKFEENYAVNDKQDVLAMCALQFASKAEITSLQTTETTTEALEKINKLTQMVSYYLEK